MKIRQIINNNTSRVAATVYENANKIVVIKRDTNNYYDSSTDERFEFNTITEYGNWLKTQEWIVKINKMSAFKKVDN